MSRRSEQAQQQAATAFSCFPPLLYQSAVPTFTNMSNPTMRWTNHTTNRLTTVTSVEIARIVGSKSNCIELKTSTGNVRSLLPVRNTDMGTSANEIMNA